jgi:serine/threonine-protein kinase
LVRIINNEPDWQALPPSTPERIQSLIVRCLRKDPAQRLRDIADARFQIEDVSTDPDASTAALPPARRYREWASWIAAALFLGATLFFATRPSTTSSSLPSIRFPVLPPDKAEFSARANTTVNVPSFALSPDGHALVFSAQMPGVKPTLWMRSLAQVDARPLAGTEGAQDPFWSPDSQWIGFFADGMLKKLRADGPLASPRFARTTCLAAMANGSLSTRRSILLPYK